jgi:cyclopropane-fatty-acyl-phospholipid synthase
VRGAVTEATGYVGSGPASIKFHYDQGDEFFALWLGSTMTYSGAMWEGPADDLQTAQLRKLDYVAEQARAQGARRVLDIGCGWGSMLRRLVEVHEVQYALGITLSEAQVAYVEADREGDPRIESCLQDWRTFEPEQPFDAIVSLGTIEHFVSMGAPEEDRANTYRELFERCHDWLPRGGRLVFQTMAQGHAPLDRRAWRDLRLVLTKIYPNAGPPWLRELIAGCAGLFEIVLVRNDRLDYVPTLMAWHRNLRANRERAVELVGEEVVDIHERFFTGLARHFMLGQAEMLRVTFSAL